MKINIERFVPSIIISAVILILALIAALAISSYDNKTYTEIEFTQYGNGSLDSYWTYELSNDDVLKEIDYYKTSVMGPGFTQHWSFEIIGEGEVTIHWNYYEAGNEFIEDESYSVTYTFDSKGHCTHD